MMTVILCPLYIQPLHQNNVPAVPLYDEIYEAVCGIARGRYGDTALAAEIGDAKTVYILPMSNGLDQFLAIRLTAGNVIQVVTDAKKADVILSDRIGAGLDQRLDDLYGTKPRSQER